MTLVAHSIFQAILLRLVANVSITVGLEPNDTDFVNIINEHKTKSTTKEALSKLLFNSEMIAMSYFSSVQFNSANVWFFFSAYAGCFVYRVWNLFYPNLPTAQQMFPFFNLTSSAFVILTVTSLLEGLEIHGALTGANDE